MAVEKVEVTNDAGQTVVEEAAKSLYSRKDYANMNVSGRSANT